jgi:hypothetical protein
MMKIGLVFLILMMIPRCLSGQAKPGSVCEANINGFKIHKVYVMGPQYNSVAWAYKHLADETCLTPVTDLQKADAILELEPLPSGAGEVSADTPVSVSCTSTANSNSCVDSTGNVLSVTCSGSNCSSYYGPDPTQVAAKGLLNLIESAWYMATAQIYTVDHKLLWRSSDTKKDWFGAQWSDLVRLGTNSPVCKVGYFQRPDYKTFRHWASTKCGVEFDPPISIDLKLLTKQAAVQDRQNEKDEMVRNAREAATKQ